MIPVNAEAAVKGDSEPEWVRHVREAYLYSSPDAAYREPAAAGSRFGKVLSSLGVGRVSVAEKLSARWEELSSADVAAHSRPRELLPDGRLIISVQNSAWYAELSRFWAAKLLERVRAVEPGVRKLVFSLDM